MSGFRYRHMQESFYPGRTVFSRKFFFNTRTAFQGGKCQQHDDFFLIFFYFAIIFSECRSMRGKFVCLFVCLVCYVFQRVTTAITLRCNQSSRPTGNSYPVLHRVLHRRVRNLGYHHWDLSGGPPSTVIF